MRFATRRSKAFFATIALLAIFHSPPGVAETLTLGSAEFPPEFVLSTDGKVSGEAAALLEKIVHKAGYSTNFKLFPTNRLLALVRDGQVDVSVATKAWEPENVGLFSRIAFGTIDICLFWRDDAARVGTIEAIDGKDVIVPLGQSTMLAILKKKAPKAVVMDATDHVSGVLMLQHGRADYLLDWEVPALANMAAHGIAVPPHLRVLGLSSYVIVSKSNPQAAEIMAKIDAAMESMRTAGDVPLR
jgi:ABC-type amino acid transport substrate-binding protein